MPTTTTFPNGTTLVSSALTLSQLNALFQNLFTQMLGLTSSGYSEGGYSVGGYNRGATSPTFNSAVRIAWQTEGAPAWKIDEDIISIRCVEEDSEYNKVRDFAKNPYFDPSVTGYSQGKYGAGPYNQAQPSYTQLEYDYEYTRVWRIGLVARGPNGVDNIRLIKSCLFLPWVHDILASNNLYVNPRFAAAIRTPELFQGRWWEIVNFGFLVNEQVNESTQINSIQSVEVILNTDLHGQVLDQTYSAP